ncbi:MAG: hypothetical protein KF785_04220 [Gemmatimonadales bacterium]|nr:hypothetical protein [Gemmatimonadales bacterium]
MRIRNVTAVFSAAGLLIAASFGAASWSATLAAVDGSSIAGRATVQSAAGPSMPTDTTATPSAAQSYTATISVTGGPANTSLAWQIHQGRCGSGGQTVGSASAYSALRTDAQGAATSTATIAGPLSEGSEYAVSVHSGSAGSPAIACGDLRASAGGTGQ